MANSIRFKRGSTIGNAGTPLAGEPIFDTSNGKLYVGDGSTSASSLTAISDDKLPLSGGTLTGSIIANTGSKITSSSADTTFSIETTSGTSIFPVLNFISSHSSVGAKIRQDGSDVITIDNDQDVTFADDVTVSGNIEVDGSYLQIDNGGVRIDRHGNPSYLMFEYDGTSVTQLRGADGGGLSITNGGAGTTWQSFNSSGNATFTGSITGKTDSHLSYSADGDTDTASGGAFHAEGSDIVTGRYFIQGYQANGGHLVGMNNESTQLVVYDYHDNSYMSKLDYDGNFTAMGTMTLGGNAYTLPSSIGSAGQVLKVPSSGTTLEWGTGGGGASNSVSGDFTITDYEPRITLTKTRNTTQSFHLAHENDDGCLDFLRDTTRTARITNNGRWVIGGHAEVDSSQLSVQGNLGVTGLAYFKYGSSSNDNVRFYNQDGSYSYIRVTADGNNANTWFDTKLGSTTWFGWTNTGGSGVSSWHFGTGGSTANNSVLISSGAIIQYNSSGSVSTTLNADGSATFGGRINVTEIRGSSVAIKDSNADLMAYFQDGSSRLYSNGYNLRLEYSNELNLYNGNSATTLYLSHNGNGSSTNISNSELIVTNGSGSTFNGVVTYSTSSGTIMSRGGFSDFIGYNSNYGTYIGGGASNASRYIYAGGYFYDGSGVRTLYHTGNLNPITTSNIGSQSVSYASNSGTLSGHDTRSVTTTPQTINAGVKFDFKNNSSNGISDGGSYHGLMTYRQYGSGGDWSGGHAHQIGFTDNTRLYHRSGTGTSWNTSWYKIHTQRDMPNSGYNGADVTLRTNSNGYLAISNWIDVTSHGIYSSNINGFHFLPNQVSDYGVARLIGTRNGYSGINYNNKTTLMMHDDLIGLYNDENNEWICYGNRNGNFYTYYNGIVKTATYTNGLYVYNSSSADAHIAEGNGRKMILQTSNRSSEFHVGDSNYTYGNFSLRGNGTSGYQGIVFPIHNDYPTVMFENSLGSGGFYYQGSDNKWAFFWHNGNDCAGIGASTTSSSYKLYVSGNVYATGSYSNSDIRLKQNIETIDSGIEKVMNMRGVYFDWNDELKEEKGKGRQTGVIAQEMNEVLPEAVIYAKDKDEYSVDYSKITGVLIEAIKDLKNEINELKKGCCNGS